MLDLSTCSCAAPWCYLPHCLCPCVTHPPEARAQLQRPPTAASPAAHCAPPRFCGRCKHRRLLDCACGRQGCSAPKWTTPVSLQLSLAARCCPSTRLLSPAVTCPCSNSHRRMWQAHIRPGAAVARAACAVCACTCEGLMAALRAVSAGACAGARPTLGTVCSCTQDATAAGRSMLNGESGHDLSPRGALRLMPL